jgi:hypothetical protein
MMAEETCSDNAKDVFGAAIPNNLGSLDACDLAAPDIGFRWSCNEV